MEPPIQTERVPDPVLSAKETRRIPMIISGAVAVVLLFGGFLLWHSESKTNQIALSSDPKPVTVVAARGGTYRSSRTYVGRLDPWVSANVGPQFVSAYVDTVLVRPGAVVKRGQVIATLDCRNASATSQAIEMEARALDSQQKALADESSRITGLLDGGFVSPNEVEQKSAQSAAKKSEVLAEKAKLIGTSLEVNDCILRAPFDGEVANRWIDPGGFVRPGSAIVSVVDRSTVRMTADVPENDFDFVAPDRKVEVTVYATGKEIVGTVTRRAPGADAETRTVHVEIDIADPTRDIPIGTTGELHVDVGEPVPSTSIPLSSATIRDTKATIFFVDGDIAHAKTFTLLGEGQGLLYATKGELAPNVLVVTQGRSLLREGDRIKYKIEELAATPPVTGPSSAAPRAKDTP